MAEVLQYPWGDAFRVSGSCPVLIRNIVLTGGRWNHRQILLLLEEVFRDNEVIDSLHEKCLKDVNLT